MHFKLAPCKIDDLNSNFLGILRDFADLGATSSNSS